jgi:hypothetical protein
LYWQAILANHRALWAECVAEAKAAPDGACAFAKNAAGGDWTDTEIGTGVPMDGGWVLALRLAAPPLPVVDRQGTPMGES